MRVRYGGSRSGAAGRMVSLSTAWAVQGLEKLDSSLQGPTPGELLQRELGDSQGQVDGRQRPQVKTEKGLGLAAVHVPVSL